MTSPSSSSAAAEAERASPSEERILIVDDERAARVGLKRALGKRYAIAEAKNGLEALTVIEDFDPRIVIVDLNMPELGGLELLERLEDKARLSCIVLTAYGNERLAVEAMKRGAFDYLTKPYDVEELRLTVEKALEMARLRRENSELLRRLEDAAGFGELVGDSAAMRRVYELIERVAALDVSVLINGASGTGKELVARAIHQRSARRDRPFVAVNCAALPETLIESELFGHRRGAFTGAALDRKGKFELAHGGTLLLDEIGDMHIDVQAKLLRALEERVIEPLGAPEPLAVDVRILASTHQDLDRAMDEGRFRRDLYYRLKVVRIELPTLSERPGDIPQLASAFLESFAEKYRVERPELTAEALRALETQSWPGNVRELKNALMSAFALAEDGVIRAEDLSFEEARVSGEIGIPEGVFGLPFSQARKAMLQDFERRFLERHLKAHQGNISRTAQALDMHRQSLQQKIKELGIRAHRFKDA